MMKSFDILGGSLYLFHENSNSLKTNFGAFLSFLTMILLGLAIFAFGQSFFKRTNPISSISTVSAVDYPIYNITNKNFSLGFRFEDFDTNQYIEDDVLYFEVIHSRDERNQKGEWIVLSREKLPISVCTKEKFLGDPAFANTADLQNIFCADFNGKDFSGNWDGRYVYRLMINVVVCEEGKSNPYTKKPCKPDSKKEMIRPINNWILSLFYQSTIYDTTSYDNGLRTIIKNDYFKLDKYLQKTKYMFFKETKLISDYGWIIKDKETNFVLGFSSATSDFNAKDSILGKPLTGFLAQFIILASRETDVIHREYIKIQTLVAEVGGIIKFCLIIFSFVGNRFAYINTVLKFKDLLSYDFNHKLFQNNKEACLNNSKKIVLQNNVSSGLDISNSNLVSSFKPGLNIEEIVKKDVNNKISDAINVDINQSKQKSRKF